MYYFGWKTFNKDFLLSEIFFFLIFIYSILFILFWLLWVLVAACGIWFPDQRAWSLSCWTTREVPALCDLDWYYLAPSNLVNQLGEFPSFPSLIRHFFFFYFLRSNHRFYPILEDPSRYSIPQAHATSPVSSRRTAQPPSWAFLLSPSSLQWVLCLLDPTATYFLSFPVSFLWGTTFRASKESVHR